MLASSLCQKSKAEVLLPHYHTPYQPTVVTTLEACISISSRQFLKGGGLAICILDENKTKQKYPPSLAPFSERDIGEERRRW